MAEDSTNALGLEFSQLNVQEKQETDSVKNNDNAEAPDESDQPAANPALSTTNRKEREKPYVNPERVKTGGSQRDKLSEEALKERMARIREQNEKIKQRRLDVQADEEAFRKTQEAERAKQAQNRKIQSDIDRARDQNAKRKMDKVQSREWDSGKPSVERHRQNADRSQAGPVPVQISDSQSETIGEATATESSRPTAPESNADSGNNWTRGGPRGRGRGRGAGNRGRGNNRREFGRPTAASESSTTEDNPPSASS